MGAVEADISMSVDGFITGPDIDQDPAGLGQGGEILYAWFRRDPDGPRAALPRDDHRSCACGWCSSWLRD
jgi:hypothetical protein